MDKAGSLEEAAMEAGSGNRNIESPLRHEPLNFADGAWRFRAPGRPNRGTIREGAYKVQTCTALTPLL